MEGECDWVHSELSEGDERQRELGSCSGDQGALLSSVFFFVVLVLVVSMLVFSPLVWSGVLAWCLRVVDWCLLVPLGALYMSGVQTQVSMSRI